MNWTSIAITARRLAMAVGLAMATTAALAAQGTQGFVPATDIAKETLPATPLVYAAYGFVWIALVVYVFLMWRRLARVERDLADVSAKLAARR
jgi:CcmD family protein